MPRFKLACCVLFVFLCLSILAQRWPWGLPAVIGQGNAPAAPTGVTASEGSYTNKIAVSWDTMRGATRYQVYRHTTNDPAAATSLGTTVEGIFYDATAVAGQSYFYWVRAENAQGASSLSAPATGRRASGTTTGLNPPPAPAGNPVTATKAALGKVLFWDEQLSSTRTVACGTCHLARGGGSDPRSISSNADARHPGADNLFGTADDIQGSPGVPLALANGSYTSSTAFGLREQVTKRRSMPHINSGYPNLLFWEGRASQVFRDPLTNAVVLPSGAALESQALEPPISDVEMGHKERNWNDVAARVAAVKPLALAPSIPAALAAWMGERRYPELFQEAFGTPEVTPVRIAMALATYQRTLNSDRAPVDRDDLTEQEARGRQVFNANECNDCHNAPLFGTNVVASGLLQIAPVAPGLFTVEANGRGLPAATVLRVKADGAQSYEPVARFDTATNRYEAVPIDFGAATDQLFLVVFGTGFRQRSALTAVAATMAGTDAEVLFAGAQGGLVGVDQVNLRLPRTLAGRGNAVVSVRVDGKTANTVTVNFK